MPARPILYNYWRSTTTYRVRVALNLKGVGYDVAPIDLLAGAQRADTYARLNPGKGVPTFVLEDGTVLTQSLAILDYIDRQWPEPPLLPSDPCDRAQALAAAYTLAVDVHPVNNLRVVQHLHDELGVQPDQAVSWMQHWTVQGLTAFEALVRSDTVFAFGDAPGLADICLIAQLYNAHRWNVDIAAFPIVQRIEAACANIPAFVAAHPDQQPDAA
ncbi:MAG: maleylacetoacetate isomerase [Tateyamaria sp.]